MMQVSNRKAVNRLALKSFLANRNRNIFAAIAMALTCLLFTCLFTAAMGVNYSFQQQTMRQVGGYAHGNFKYLTEEQADELKDHPLVKEYGSNLILSALYEDAFAKHMAEIRYFDNTSAKMFFSYPTTGTLPVNKYDFATDTTVLNLLGIKPIIGETISISYNLGGKVVTDTFRLSGYWTLDDLMPTSQIAFSEEYVKEKLKGYTPLYEGDTTGTWDLEYMFKNSLNIESNLWTIARDKGYQAENSEEDNYLDYGVNWAYTSAQMNKDYTIAIAVFGIGLLILLTGYLIIYNVFLISVASDIRFYGLLKTIGTTGRQIKRIIRYQAFLLSLLGIPVGLVLGYVFGSQITPIIMSSMSVTTTYQSANPVIFIGAVVFTVVTVLISIRKPGRIAAKVSPVEAVRYTDVEVRKDRKNNNRGRKTASLRGACILRMAVWNLLRNKKKTVIVIISMALSISLLNFVFAFASGFDMDKYMDKFLIADFKIASSNYFNVNKGFRQDNDVVTENFIQDVKLQKGIEAAGGIFYNLNETLTSYNQQMEDIIYRGIPEEYLINSFFTLSGRDLKYGRVQLYGMEEFILNKLQVVEGTFDLEKFKTGKYILLAVDTDDYDNPLMETAFYQPGDKVELNYIDEMNYSETEQKEYRSQTYEVMALVKNDISWNVHYYSTFAMILPAETFIQDTKTSTMMSYQFDVEAEEEASMETFLSNYTENKDKEMNYASKETYEKEFEGFKSIFVIIGNALSSVMAIIGILNFINVILTGIITRRREFSVLKSIGMTGKQLQTMLMYEGLGYAGITLIVTIACSALLNVTLLRAMGEGFWFFTARFTLLPVMLVTPLLLLLSGLIPIAVYRATNKESLVDQLRVN